MLPLHAVVYLLVSILSFANGEPIHLHLQSDVVVSDYTGPLTKEMLHFIKKTEIVEFRQCNLTEIGGHFVTHLTNLKKLSFINCTINVDGIDFENLFHGADHLREFTARHIKPKYLRPDVLRTIPLEVYVMTDQVYPRLPDNLLNETKLRKLELCRNHLKEIAEGAFNGLDKLEILDLETNWLKNLPKPVLAPLKSLKILKLGENRFKVFNSADLPELPNLVTIDLGFNALTELKLDDVEKVTPNLETVIITGSQLTEAQIKELRDKNPKINIKTK